MLFRYDRMAVMWIARSAAAAIAGQSCSALTAGAVYWLSTRIRTRCASPGPSLPATNVSVVFPGSFTRLAEVIGQMGLPGAIDGLLFDLGVSSPQLDDASRGFSFLKDGHAGYEDES